MPLENERVTDRSVRGEGALRMGRGLEALHLPLAPSDLQMRILSKPGKPEVVLITQLSSADAMKSEYILNAALERLTLFPSSREG